MSERTLRRIERKVNPGPIERYFRALNPIKSLGESASGDFFEYQFTISIILFFSLTIAILSTIMFNLTRQENSQEKYLITAFMSISWFVFANFTFLVLEGTRFFNILLFIVLIILASVATNNLDDNTPAKNLGISVIALSVFPALILLYYFLTSEKGEITQLKTIEREQRKKEEIKEELRKYKKKLREEIKAELKEDVTSETGVRSRVADAYIDALIENAKKNIKITTTKDKDKDEEKKGKKKGKEKEEEEK